MITANQLQRQYVKWYRQLRNYIWPYNIVCALADVEVAIYRVFPALNEVKQAVYKLKSLCYRYVKDDQELIDEFETLIELIEENSTIYSKIDKRQERLNHEDIEEA